MLAEKYFFCFLLAEIKSTAFANTTQNAQSQVNGFILTASDYNDSNWINSSGVACRFALFHPPGSSLVTRIFHLLTAGNYMMNTLIDRRWPSLDVVCCSLLLYYGPSSRLPVDYKSAFIRHMGSALPLASGEG